MVYRVNHRRDETEKASFYESIESFTDFSDVTDLSRYRPAPDDWYVVIADITGSTNAIIEGRYKDVNMVGAATITAAINVTRAHEVPYVFGGDGATMLVPPHAFDRVCSALIKTKHLAQNQFGLPLRLGAVPVSRVRQEKLDVLVAKYQLSPGNYLAMFSGGGVGRVDELIKADDGSGGTLIEDEGNGEDVNLEGLSCRWEPLAAQRGVMLSLLIKALPSSHEEATDVYREVLEQLNRVLGPNAQQAKPVGSANLKFKFPPRGLDAEARLASGVRSYLQIWFGILMQSVMQVILHATNGKAGSYNAPIYKKELVDNSDFRRFDDTMRIVLDCTAQEVRDIEDVLADFRKAEKVAYGLHQADSALMTCLVFSLTNSEHVHFIDGGDGGFSIAARGLKQQLAQSRP